MVEGIQAKNYPEIEEFEYFIDLIPRISQEMPTACRKQGKLTLD